MNPHEQLIEEFYAAFSAYEAETMSSCYHPEVIFSDPVFGTLHGKDASDMWRMLVHRSKGKLRIAFSDIKADQQHGSAKWVANYEFSKTGRQVTNEVTAHFVFKDGLIIEHKDDFDFGKWASQAFGFTGWLLGNTAFFKNKVRNRALASLKHWQNQNPMP